MYKYILFTAILASQLFALYGVGDQITDEDQEDNFDYCHPTIVENGFKKALLI